jgi:hypothetical protein
MKYHRADRYDWILHYYSEMILKMIAVLAVCHVSLLMMVLCFAQCEIYRFYIFFYDVGSLQQAE